MSKRFLSGINVTGTATLNTVADAGSNTDKFLVLDASNNVSYRTAAELYSDLGIGALPSAYTSTLKHEVKASQTISKGQAVYVSSADGTNMIVSKASNVSEATSSKTMGLLETSLVTNGKGNVITEGLLSGLNTNGAAAGDPVWLGVDGALIFGLINKPVAPAHLVFIGIVTRANANNGEIFVKVQNGFEMKELHNYAEGSVQNNEVIVYESATSLYKPKSIPTILGYTPVPDSRTITINGTTYDLSANRSWTVSANQNARTEYEFTTNGSTATYSAVYSVGQVDVFYNGSKLSSTEFTASNGTSVTLGFTPPSGQLVEVVAWETGGGVTNGRTLTINGVAFDLSANRSWTIDNASLGAQAQLNGTGLVRMNGTTVTYDNATYATQSYVTTAVSNLVNSAPSTLDTLNELATALGNDANFATTVTNSIATKLPLSGGTLTGALSGTVFNSSNYSKFYNVNIGGTASGTYALYSDGVIGNGNLHLATTAGSVYINSQLALPLIINPVGGNVMIGTSVDAGYKLDVIGTTRISGTSQSMLDVTSSSTSGTIFSLNNSGGGGNWRTYSSGSANGEGAGHLFWTYNAGSPLVIFKNNGFVGIGTITPTALLQVSSPSGGIISINSTTTNTFRGLIFQNNAASDGTEYAYLKYNATSGEFRIYANPAGFGGFMSFYSNNTESVRLTAGGNFLIGTTTDGGYKLSVSGAAYVSGNLNYNSGSAIYPRTTTVTDWYLCKHNAVGDRIENGLGTNNPFTLGNHIGSTYTANIFLYGGGNATFNGAVSKGSGSFKIDHPLEKMSKTHHLVHSFVESPQANNIYRGKVQLVNGKAEVNLDIVSAMTEGTFVALNREIHTYTSNETDWDSVRGKVECNILTIECQNNQSSAIVSWLVIGERQDKHMMDTDWTDENGKVIVEPLKKN